MYIQPGPLGGGETHRPGLLMVGDVEVGVEVATFRVRSSIGLQIELNS